MRMGSCSEGDRVESMGRYAQVLSMKMIVGKKDGMRRKEAVGLARRELIKTAE